LTATPLVVQTSDVIEVFGRNPSTLACDEIIDVDPLEQFAPVSSTDPQCVRLQR
jgi:hypothetical protein